MTYSTSAKRVATLLASLAGIVTLLALAFGPSSPAGADPTPYPSGSGSAPGSASTSPTTGAPSSGSGAGSASPTTSAPGSGGASGIASSTAAGGTGGGTQLVAGVSVTPGAAVYVSVTIPDGVVVSLEIHSKTYDLGTKTGTGKPMALSFTIPSDISLGLHHFTVTGTSNGTVYEDIPFTVVAGGSGSGSGQLSNTGVAVIGIGVIGLVLIGGGGALVLAGRRRRGPAH